MLYAYNDALPGEQKAEFAIIYGQNNSIVDPRIYCWPSKKDAVFLLLWSSTFQYVRIQN